MTRPDTGTTWKAGGFNDVDSRFLERGGLIAALIRDAHGASTDISPHNPDGSVKWSPFAEDGQLRDDLFAFKKSGAYWVPNTDQNEGFHLVAAFKEGNGPKKSAKIDTDDYMIEQQNTPFDSEVVKDVETFNFTGVETARPLLRRLRNNLPLSDAAGTLLVEAPGGADAGWSKPLAADRLERQVLLLRARRKAGKEIYTCTGYSLATLSSIGDSTMGKKDADAAELGYTAQPDGIFMAMIDDEYQPIIRHEWVGGGAWAELGNGVAFGSDIPVATAGSSGGATVKFNTPTGGTTPYTYTVEVKVGSGSFGAATVAGSPTVSGGKTTVTLSGLTAGSSVFRVTVTDAASKSAVSATSTAITVT